MICRKCGCRVSDTATFCEKCGAPMAEFGISKEKRENILVKKGKAFAQKVKDDRKFRIIIVVACVLLVLVALGRWYINKDKVFGIGANMSVEQVKNVLGKEVTVNNLEDGTTVVIKENVKIGKYNGSLSVGVGNDATRILWLQNDGRNIPKQDLIKMMERKYGENQAEENDFFDVYIGESKVWDVEVSVFSVTYNDNDVEECSDVEIFCVAK